LRIRIGHSTDIHRLEAGDTLYLGGIAIPASIQSVAHSDGDCLLHAISEAMLGALALGDLGTHYPDDVDHTRNMDSKKILREVVLRVSEEGYALVNLDAMVFLESLKLKPHISAMRETIAKILSVDISKISIKATTAEKLGMIGQDKAIASECVVLLEQKSKIEYL